jgi:tetratricopeptide (TPR) repeat protein
MNRSFFYLSWLPLLLLAAGCTSISENRIALGIVDRMTFRGGSKAAIEDQVDSNLSPEQRAVNLVLAEGKTYESEGQLDQAATIYQRVLAKHPNHPAVAHRMAVVYARQGLLEEAEKMWQIVTVAEPECAAILCDLGYFHYLQDRWPQAEFYFQQALQLDPALPAAHANLGMLWARQGNVQDAYASFRRAGCSHPEAENNLAFALLLEQRWQESQQHYQRSIRHAPKLSQAQLGLEVASRMMHRRPESQDPQYGRLPPISEPAAHSQPAVYASHEHQAAAPPSWTTND